MGAKAFDDFLKYIQAEIGSLINTVTFLNKSVEAFTGKPQLAEKLETAKANLKPTNEKIKALKDFFNMIRTSLT